MSLLAGGGKVVGICIETDAFSGWSVTERRLEAPNCAAVSPSCADEGVIDVDADNTACTPRVSWLVVSGRSGLDEKATDFAGDPALVAADVEDELVLEEVGTE